MRWQVARAQVVGGVRLERPGVLRSGDVCVLWPRAMNTEAVSCGFAFQPELA